jgi:hypothetical protein
MVKLRNTSMKLNTDINLLDNSSTNGAFNFNKKLIENFIYMSTDCVSK